MITMLLAALQIAGSPSPDSAAVYTLLLQGVRTEHPDARIILSETRSGVRCMPHCGASSSAETPPDSRERPADETRHGPSLVAALREKKLIDGTCPVTPRVFGCPEAARSVFVGLGEIAERPEGSPPAVEGSYWVRVAILDRHPSPCSSETDPEDSEPEGFGYWALVRRQPDGTWRLVRRMPAFSV
jgi:hypothetical protein